jgi:hypothetical protein
MEPEDVVHVLRRLLEALPAGGAVVDLASVPPDGLVEAGGRVVGRLDESAFFARARVAAAGLDDLVAKGVLARQADERFPVFIDYPTGADAVADVAQRSYGRMPDVVAARLTAITEPVRIREHSLVRSFTLRPAPAQK